MADTAPAFRNIYVSGTDSPTFCFRSGMTVYEETFHEGRYLASGWNGAGYTLNVLESFPTRLNPDDFTAPQAFDLEADGRSLQFDWEYQGFAQREEETGLHGTIRLLSRLMPLQVEVHTLLDGTAVLTRWLTVQNLSEKPVNLSAIAPLCGGLESLPDWKSWLSDSGSTPLYSLGYFASSHWGMEGNFGWHDLPDAGYRVAGKYGRDRHRHPMFMLKNNATGAFFIAQLGWSGGYTFDFDLDTEDFSGKSDAHLSYRIGLDSPKPMLILRPGEQYDTPRVHIGMLQGDLDDAVQEMHCHIRKTVFTLPDARGRRGWLEAGMGPERLMDVAATKHFADTAAAVGAETLIIDAGWYCPPGTACAEWWKRTGDWSFDPARYPNGIAEIRDYIHAKGLLFGLWMDAERIGPASKIYEQHPDWVIHRYDGKESSLLDFAKPEVAQWVEAQISHLIDDYHIDLFRLDYNIGSVEICYRSEQDGVACCGTARYYQAIYRLYENLRRRYPDVIFENCAGGGGRTDLAFVRNFTHTWVSDWQVAPRSFSITNGMTMALPPEVVDRLVGGMNSHTMASLDFQTRVTLFARPTTNDYNAVGSEFNPQQLEFVRHSFEIYKNFIRPFQAEAKIYHHTPETGGINPQGTGILERAAADGSRGVIGVFQLAGAHPDEVTVFPRGVDISQNYSVTFDNSRQTAVVSGYQLKNDGLRLRIPASLSSELILYRKI